MSLFLSHAARLGWRAVPGRPGVILFGTATDHWSSALVAELEADTPVREALAEVFSLAVVDVAEAPALAITAQLALAACAGASGWPCLLVTTDDGQPFGALPWGPLRDRDRTPGVARLLLEAAEAWHLRTDDCRADAARFAALRASLLAPAQGKPLRKDLALGAVEAAAMEAADPLEGGFGPAPRGNDAELLSFLLERAQRPDAPLGLVQQLERTLVARLAAGVHDHLRGGFTRGSGDTAGRAPFHDLRLTDQCRLAVVLHRAATVLARPLFAEAARDALARVRMDLDLGGGRLAHGLHSDAPEGPGRWADGAHRRWTEAQVAEIVGAEGARLLAERYGLGDEPAVPVLSATSTDHRRLGELLMRWRVAAAERPAPRRDDRVLAHEQGQALWAFAVCGLPHEDLLAHVRTLTASDPLAAAWLARGLLAAGDATAAAPRLAQALAAVDEAGHLRLDALTISDVDTHDGPGGAGLLALTLLEAGRDPWPCLEAHRDRLRTAPLACASLAEAGERAR